MVPSIDATALDLHGDQDAGRPVPTAVPIGVREHWQLAARRITETEMSASVWWLGVHGGAGESTLETLFVGSRACDHLWPVGPIGAPTRVVLVARTNAHGLRAVQTAVRDASERELAVSIRGLVLMADAPGRLPRQLRELAELVAGAASPVWRFPWVPAWRLGEPPSGANAPCEAAQLLEQLVPRSESG